ncbi:MULTISPECIES: phosphotransferase [Microbacterium]|uniref:Aminoglycoside phosphotransferase family protein n=1 Tax=Microbacterium wangchenii TaxID=2541726 RepID=A0ABX5SUH6_9MICO|nr:MULTISPECIES: phosphotransferase [Microbacterium]MCK6065337.1 aminoglycoside phosphotransferase family protein [Microbacterium sp. EYE_512]QBR88783.1 aminoglycoside phosphotransferase family protein [Microbacterium wangchenii]TFV82163.1 aminoglycoside phosphotransferase family protein [Microbacterium sp. dk485]TXK20507.1 phosphotransferase [Microbacterium wangchenii]
MSAPGNPPPTGRVAWADLPAAVRHAITARAGGDVVATDLAATGFSPGFAGVLHLAGGGRLFLKAGDGATNAETFRLHTREAEIARALPAGVAPALRWSLVRDGWVVLAFDAVEGRHPGGPWTAADLGLVLAAHAALAAHPAPPVLAPIGPRLKESLVGWTRLGAARGAGVPAWAAAHVEEFARWERESVAADTAGDAIVHMDLRSDNVLIDGDTVHVLDWPHAGRGAPWVDAVLLAPTVSLEGGPAAAEVFARSPLGAGADPGAVRRMVAAWAGWLLWSSGRPDPPGIPHLRAFQRAQAAVTLEWLRQLL